MQQQICQLTPRPEPTPYLVLAPAADRVDGHAPAGILLSIHQQVPALIPDRLVRALTLVPVLHTGAGCAGHQLRHTNKQQPERGTTQAAFKRADSTGRVAGVMWHGHWEVAGALLPEY